jgi:lactate dehydrogenase-like 2-hydroxyacid dehydrogenase
MAWALLFSAARRIVEAHKFTEQKKFKNWEATLFLGNDISGKTLGIIGAGRIGTAFGLMSKGFNMKVLYTNPEPNIKLETEVKAVKTNLDELIKKSDFISLHVPLLPETKYLINKNKFSLMKKNCILINTSRGPVINEKDLADALIEKKIAYAGLDVYENEPEINDKLFNLDNIVLAPHIASASQETRDKMAVMAAENIISVLKNNKAINQVF